MPLLTPPATPPNPTPPELTPEQIAQRAEVAARNIRKIPRQIVDLLLPVWIKAFDGLWTETFEGSIAARLEALGEDGGELLERNTALVAFLLEQLAGEDQETIDFINAKMASIPAHTVAPDGTVTLD